MAIFYINIILYAAPKSENGLSENLSPENNLAKEAIAYHKRGHYDKAIELFNEALKIALTPVYTAYILNGRGLTYLSKKEYGKAIADFNQAMQLNPDEDGFIALCYNHRAAAYFHSGQYKKSWQDIQQILDMDYIVDPGFLAALRREAEETRICEVHGTKLEEKEVPIRWGLILPPDSDEPTFTYRMKNFPNAQEFVTGGCIVPVDKKETERIFICPDCQKAKEEWFKKHKTEK